MDNHPHRSDHPKAGPPSPGPSRKRSRGSSEDEDRAIEEKRIKARERQRRKRERDRSGRDKSGGSAMGATSFPPHDDDPSHQMSIYGPPVELANGHGRGRSADLSGLSPEEAAKKERIRTAARERQRKHRASVKAKRMAELGMAIVNAGGGVEQTAVGYVLNEHGQYEPVMEDPNGSHHSHVPHEPPFPAPQAHNTPGQTFASTLLLSFSCAPLLKQHLLRNLHMSEEELASFEPIIAAAWDHWEHERALHYAAAAGGPNSEPSGPSTSYLPPHPPPHPHPHAQLYPSSDFRARFHRPLVAPFPSSAPPILRPEGTVVHAGNGSATTNGSYVDHREDGDSDGQDDHDDDGRSSPPVPAANSIDPALEAGGTSDVRGEREVPPPLEQGRVSEADARLEKHETED
ncbi:hypothetical protein JB92DRAFT_3104375 [Gautieria morchelliformis]|nr:hypothetical protein JB92DRAFT_3104375 [Gautieria morchelliformis]